MDQPPEYPPPVRRVRLPVVPLPAGVALAALRLLRPAFGLGEPLEAEAVFLLSFLYMISPISRQCGQ